MHTTNLTHFARLYCAMLLTAVAITHSGYASSNAEVSFTEISEDFGPYSANPAQEIQEKLTELGDWNASVQSLDEAISNFYGRTELPPSDTSTQQLLDVSMAVSAEREAKRALGEDSSEQMQAYAYTIAPWLKTSVKPIAPPANQLIAERSALTTAISSLDSTLKELSDTIEVMY